jgi:transketolase
MVHGGSARRVRRCSAGGRRAEIQDRRHPDEHTVTGSQADIFRHYGITMESLAQTAVSLLS